MPSIPQRKARLLRLLRQALLAVAGGLGYALFVRATGLGIPCPFHALTGLDCPGCGVSRMCMALLRLDVRAAWEANCALFVILPAALVYAALRAVRYVLHGATPLTRAENAAFCVTSAALCVFGVVRNLV